MVMATALVDLTPADHFNDYVFIKETAKVFLENNTTNSHHGGNDTTREISQRLIGNALCERVDTIDHETCDAGDEDTFFVADLGEVYRQHLRWKLNLPRVKPFYGEFSRDRGYHEQDSC